MNNDILGFHKQELEKFGIPHWCQLKCPFCGKSMPLRSIRSVSIKLNTRNMGDIAIEFCCAHCSVGDVLYFPREAKNMGEFIDIISDNISPVSTPIIEEEMYKLNYNNVMNKMIKEDDTI